jgi:6-phospho-beta-glucosidase
VKIAVIGGGSTYTPELVSGLSRERERIDVRELVLHDIDAERREVVGGLAQRMLERQGYDGELAVTEDLDRAVDGADFVLIQIRVGGQEARLLDETVPLVCGCIGQETTGAGGLAKALRTVPVVLEIADRVRDRAASDAWIIDFTNPVGIVTRALLDAGHRAIGLCNVAITLQRRIAGLLGVEPKHVEIDQIGLNHLSWARFVRVDGTDVLPELIATHGDELAEAAGVPARLVEELGALPSYYLHYFYAHDRVLAEQLDGVPRAATVAEIERELLQMYRDPELTEKPPLLEQRGGAFYSECAIGLVGSIAADTGDVHVVDVRNGTTIRGLAEDDVVEVPARVGRSGAVPLPQPPVAPELLGLIQHVSAYERLAVEAATSGDPVVARKALLTHPLISQHAPAEELVDRLLEAGAAHLPQFARAGEPIA